MEYKIIEKIKKKIQKENSLIIGILEILLIPLKKDWLPYSETRETLEKIILGSSNEDDIICDFFSVRTLASVAEKIIENGFVRILESFQFIQWKRLINVQRELKSSGKNWRAFEILNLGKYQRQYFIFDGKNERDERKQFKKRKTERI